MVEFEPNEPGGLCCCCIGLAIGYLLLHNDCCHGAQIKKLENGLERTAIIETGKSNAIPKNFILRQIDRYQTRIGPQMKAAVRREDICRYEPSCSEYARQAVGKHGQIKGGLMAIIRLTKCNPLSKGGYDPVA